VGAVAGAAGAAPGALIGSGGDMSDRKLALKLSALALL
jgi:hypothetical protein